MRVNASLLLAAILLSAGCHTAVPAPQSPLVAEALPAFSVSFETSLEKVFPVDLELAMQAPAAARLSLAANESEAFQLIVLARRDLEKVSVSVGPLKSAGGSEIPASALTVNTVGYVPVIEPFYKPYYLRLENQPLWPDPLLETDSAAVKAGTVQPFWITLHAPRGTSPGDYSATLSVAADGHATVTAALTVHVYDFELPSQSRLKTCFWLYPRYIRQYYGFEDRDDPAYHRMIFAYYEDMLDHRMSHADISYDIPAPVPMIDEFSEPDFSRWDAYMQRWIDRGLNFFAVPISRNDPDGLIKLKAAVWGRHLEEKGWSDLACTLMYDETTEGKDQRRWVHEGFPAMRNALTWHPTPDCPDVDVWIPQAERGYELYLEAVEWARDRGDELWMYTSSPRSGPEPEKTAFYPNTNIDFPATHCRLMAWVCWQENLSGYLYWCVNHWQKDPWETAETFPNQNGNGSFYYPGPDGPVHSLRLEAFRDGMEDYEYFYLLRTRCRAAKAAGTKPALVAEAEKALSLWDDLRPFMYDVNRNPSMLYERREAVARLIEALGD